MTDAIAFALAITVPNLSLMGLGFFMRRIGQASDDFIHDASYLVFHYCLPCLLFFTVLNNKVDIGEQISLILAGVCVTFVLFLMAEIYAHFFIKKIEDKGVFVQGVFRGNIAIIGLATIHNAYGDNGLGIGVVYMGVITILYNVLAVITLSRTSTNNDSSLFTKSQTIIKKIISNQLILALLFAFIYKSLSLPIPHPIIEKTASLLAAVTLPLALICAGATLNIKDMFYLSGVSMQASMGRIVIAPLIAVLIGYLFGMSHLTDHTQMGVLFLMSSVPVASVSFVMAKAMGGNEELAANILAFTTVFSMIAMGIGAGILRGIGWM